jgi:hypothetical protein
LQPIIRRTAKQAPGIPRVLPHFLCAPRHSVVARQHAKHDPEKWIPVFRRDHASSKIMIREIKSGGFDECGVAMSAMSQQQSLAQTWKRRQRRQRVLVAVVVAALLAALAYGWLHVFGMF